MKKKRAIFTPLFIPPNEDGDSSIHLFFLKKWVEYYSRHFDESDMYVIFHGGRRELLDGFQHLNFIEMDDMDITCYHDKVDVMFKKSWSVYEMLLNKYEYVVMTDLDEFLYHPMGLGKYIDDMKEDYVTSTGYEIIHLKDKEPAFDSTKKILEQRGYWYANPVFFSKTLISNKKLNWNIGNHKLIEQDKKKDENLILLHMHKFDYGWSWSNHLKRSRERVKANDKKMSWHYRIGDEREFEKWFYTPDASFTRFAAFHNIEENAYTIEEIPKEIKGGIDI